MDAGYSTSDVSRNTLSSNYFSRGVNPVGTLAHTTEGRNALYTLQSGNALSGHPASADYYIERSGQRYSLMPPGMAAYHAGVSWANVQGRVFQGDALSAILIGVELERAGDDVVTYAQLDSYAELLTILSVEYSWRWPYTILGHYEVARPLGRRSDPVNFAWGDFMGRVYARSLAAGVPGLV